MIFEEMGFRYVGPLDGHDYDTLVDVISNARRIPGPVLIHVRTVKGKGFHPAENPTRARSTASDPTSIRPTKGSSRRRAAGRPSTSPSLTR